MARLLERAGRAPALLWVVLGLVLLSFGLLVAALTSSRTMWAWGSVAASGVAGGLLAAEWLGRRRVEPQPPPAAPEDHDEPEAPGAGAATAEAAPPEPQEACTLDPSVEPAEEHTDVGDAIAIADLSDEVRVIDERPRYHLDSCRWVGDRETIPLPASEARELGFTPCAVCSPDSTLAARHRTTRAGSGVPPSTTTGP